MRDQPVCGGFQRDSGQSASEVRFVNRDGAEALCDRVGAQPAKCQFIRCSKHHDDVGSQMPMTDDTGMSDREVERGVCRLASLRSGRQVTAGDEVEARDTALMVRHGAERTRQDRQLARDFPRARVRTPGGAITKLPGAATWLGFWVMVLAMVALGGGSLLALQTVRGREAARRRQRLAR